MRRYFSVNPMQRDYTPGSYSGPALRFVYPLSNPIARAYLIRANCTTGKFSVVCVVLASTHCLNPLVVVWCWKAYSPLLLVQVRLPNDP